MSGGRFGADDSCSVVIDAGEEKVRYKILVDT